MNHALNKIQTWQERCQWGSSLPATELMVAAMKQEILELRQHITEKSKMNQDVFFDGVEAVYPLPLVCDHGEGWMRQSENRSAMWNGIDLACKVFSGERAK